METRSVERVVETVVHIAEMPHHVVETLEDENGELHIRARKIESDPAVDKFAWRYVSDFNSDAYFTHNNELSAHGEGWSPEFDG